MNKRLYRVIRDLHLYFGLFISPFVVVFAVSVFFLVHPSDSTVAGAVPVTRTVSDVPLPSNLQSLSGRARIEALRPVLQHAGVYGEIGFVQHRVKEHRLSIPVTIPGRETRVTVDTVTRSAQVETVETGLIDALMVLHKLPGPHLVNMRMNWIYIAVWRWLADATVCLILFLSASGIYLWYALRAERTIGVALLAAGAVSFVGIVYALSH
jgi:hypothetical protein